MSSQRTRLESLQTTLQAKFPGCALTASHGLDHPAAALILRITPAELVATMTRLRDDTEFDFKLLIDLAGVHYPERAQPFEVVYQLLSVYKNHRLRVKVAVGEGEAVPSVIGVWKSANWYEREAYDMFGILFSDHPDLRRILNEYDFEGHPLRKDFPLSGNYDLFYDEAEERVARRPVQLMRPNREFYRPNDSR